MVAAANATGGAPAPCAEATYGEITLEGLQAVLHALAAKQLPKLGLQDPSATSPDSARLFDIFLDLGAGPGRTAAAAVLLGLAGGALGVELGPQRFALGCHALAKAAVGSDAGSDAGGGRAAAAAAPAVAPATAPGLELLRGDARDWPRLVADSGAGGGAVCGQGWAVFIGAACFRDALLANIAHATLRACTAGARMAVLARRLPLAAQSGAGEGTGHFEEVGSVRARTTWSEATEVFLYRLVA